MSCDRNWKQAFPALATLAGVSAERVESTWIGAKAQAQRGDVTMPSTTQDAWAGRLMRRIRDLGIAPPGSQHGGGEVTLPDGTTERVPAQETGRAAAAYLGLVCLTREAMQTTDRAIQTRAATDPLSRMRQAAALNPALSPLLLHTLAQDADVRVATAVAGNPALPPGVATRLQERLPALPPDAARGLVHALVRNPATPVAVITALIERADAPAAIAAHPNLTVDGQRHLAQSPDPDVRHTLAAHPALTTEALATLVRDADPGVQQRLAARADLPPDAVRVLATDPVAEVRGMALGLAPLPANVQAQAIQTTDARDRWSLAGNPSLLAAQQQVLAQDRTLAERLAGNPGIVPDVQALLATQAWLPRITLAGNPGIAPDVQALLARDAAADVRTTLAANPALDGAARAILQTDPHPAVQQALAANPERSSS